MKRKMCLIIVVLFSFIIMGAMINKDNFIQCEKEFFNKTTFVENGVKVTYKCDDIELVTFKNNLLNMDSSYCVNVFDNEVKATNDYETIEIIRYRCNSFVNIDISIINKNNKLTTRDLFNKLTLLQGKKYNNERYFKFIKGKIDNDEQGLNVIKNMQNIKNINALEICNGYTGTADFKCGQQRVNFAVSRYNSDHYVIIGTPVIFTTY